MVKISPKTQDFPFANGTVHLSWETINGNSCQRDVIYTIYISATDPITVVNSREYTINLPDGIYDWNVTTFNGLQGTSNTGSFRVCTVSAPQLVLLVFKHL